MKNVFYKTLKELKELGLKRISSNFSINECKNPFTFAY